MLTAPNLTPYQPYYCHSTQTAINKIVALTKRVANRQAYCKAGTSPLTYTDAASLPYTNPVSANLEQWGISMRGIYPEGHCPVPNCGKTFQRKTKGADGYYCPEHRTAPTRYKVVIQYNGEPIKRNRTLEGETLRTLGAAHALYTQAQGEIKAKTFDPEKWKSKDPQEFKFAKLVWKWHEEKEDQMKQGKLSYGYIPLVRGYIKNYFEPFFHGKDVREIRTLRDFARELPNLAITKSLSPKQQTNIIHALEGFFNWLWDERILKELPVFPKKIDVPEHIPVTVGVDIQDKYLEFVPAEHRSIFAYLLYQGARPSEVCALKGDCIDLKNNQVTYRRGFSGRKFVEHTKTKQMRVNTIFSKTLAILPKAFPVMFVFTYGQGKNYTSDLLYKIHRDTLKKYNEEYSEDLEISLYELTKHSFGTWFINNWPDKIEVLREHFGHSSLAMTRRYAIMQGAKQMSNTVEPLRKPCVTTP